MASATIEDLFDHNRIPNGVSFLIFLLYCPFGVLLCLLRLIFCVQLGIILVILPKASFIRKIILRICGTILGIILIVKDQEKSDIFKILVCNNISTLDSLIMESVEAHVLVSKRFRYPAFIQWMMGYKSFLPSITAISTQMKEDQSMSESKCSALVFPEESATNGKVSLLKFSPWPFKYGCVYQPVLLTAKRPSILPIKLSVVNGTFWSDFLWTLFVPYTIFRIRYLLKMEKQESMTPEDFAKVINREISNALSLQPSQFDVNDKKEYIKRVQKTMQEMQEARQQIPPRRQLQQQNAMPRVNSTAKLDRLVQQVKDVFPQIPRNVVRQDIMKTNSVDVTLGNILEGRLSYTPLTEEESLAERRLHKEKTKPPVRNKTIDTGTSRKGMSYQERKHIMIEEAKRRYLERHPEYCSDLLKSVEK
ncbi:lipid droplet-regulating VLDL assembly factor AUP1-like [Rhopilema esculentum]|uniref:lipid droplet-regulating VLDL assembly factor AUP1-like n=1 Tax=Rhopilema esculentum TaxID=499914 RepID=UPI0031E0AA9E